jgi:hypothetical protein
LLFKQLKTDFTKAIQIAKAYEQLEGHLDATTGGDPLYKQEGKQSFLHDRLQHYLSDVLGERSTRLSKRSIFQNIILGKTLTDCTATPYGAALILVSYLGAVQ